MWKYRFDNPPPCFDELMHYGVKGQRKGLRRYQNEDGSLTAEGRDHYGVGEERQPGSTASTQQSNSERNYRVRRFGKSSAKVLEKKPQTLSPKEQAARDAKRKKMIAAAAGLTIVAIGIGVAAKQHSKLTKNLIEAARLEVHDKYQRKQEELDRRTDLTKTERYGAQSQLSLERHKAIDDVYSRGSAKKVLGLNGRENRERYKSFIKNNNLRKVKTSELVERRTGSLVEGHYRSRRTGRMEPYTERMRRRRAEQIVRRGTVY